MLEVKKVYIYEYVYIKHLIVFLSAKSYQYVKHCNFSTLNIVQGQYLELGADAVNEVLAVVEWMIYSKVLQFLKCMP
jgi:hypothetical protein